MDKIIDIGPECFISGDGNVICYKGENFYRMCGEYVADNPFGGQAFCVKRIGHGGKVHESFNGLTRKET